MKTIILYTIGGQASGDMSSIFPDMSQQFSKEVEDEANGYFQRIYNQPPHPTMSIDEVLDMLKRFKDSPNRKEKVSTYVVYFRITGIFIGISWSLLVYHDVPIYIILIFQSNVIGNKSLYITYINNFLCPRIEWSGAYCFCPVCLSVCLSVCLFVCLLSTLTFAITFEP